ncbi:hypothetical protein TNCV_5113331 [Trichonephila clavipes]|nr:hypothetical protein TNCV_5113331 [Trichonephila clavipes]
MIDADSDDENKMTNAAPITTSPEMMNIIKKKTVTQLSRITNRIARKITMGISIYSVSENEGTSLQTIIIPPYPNLRVIHESLSIGKDSDC